jgi:hypothetical protein
MSSVSNRDNIPRQVFSKSKKNTGIICSLDLAHHVQHNLSEHIDRLFHCIVYCRLLYYQTNIVATT